MLSVQLGIPQNTISTWKKNKEKIRYSLNVASTTHAGVRKRQRESQYPDVERALLFWLRDMHSRDSPAPIDLNSLMVKAER